MKKIISMLLWKYQSLKQIGPVARFNIQDFDDGPLTEQDAIDIQEFWSNMGDPITPAELRNNHLHYALTPIGWYAAVFLYGWLLDWKAPESA